MYVNENQKYFSAVGIPVVIAEAIELTRLYAKETMAFQHRLEIENTTDREVLVSLRQGITYAVKPTASVIGNKGPGILIRNFISVDKTKVRIDVRNQLNDPINAEQQLLQKCVATGSLDNPSRANHGVEYFVPKSDLETRVGGGVIYLANCDIQLSFKSPEETPEHPFSQPGIELHNLTDNDFLNSKEHVGISLKLVDNSNVVGDRFVNLGGTILHLRPVKSVMLQDGLYVTLNGISNGGRRAPQPKAQYYPTEEMDKAFSGLYRTVEEAMSLGDIFKQEEKERTLREQELKNRDQELKNEKLHLQSQAQELERKNLDAKAELESLTREKERVKHERDTAKLEYERRLEELQSKERELEHVRKMESMRRNDYYDERGHQRKDMSENTKMLLQITAQVVIGIIIPYIMKMSK